MITFPALIYEPLQLEKNLAATIAEVINILTYIHATARVLYHSVVFLFSAAYITAMHSASKASSSIVKSLFMLISYIRNIIMLIAIITNTI